MLIELKIQFSFLLFLFTQHYPEFRNTLITNP